MKIILTNRGSRGDVYPIIEIASELKKRGHDVSVCVPKLFENLLKERELHYHLYQEDSQEVMAGFGSGWDQLTAALDWFSRSIEEQFDVMLETTRDADMLITGVNELAGPSVAEFSRIQHVRIAYTPVLAGSHPPPLVPLQKMPAFINRIMWNMLSGGSGLFMRKFLDKKRKDLDLAPIGPVDSYFTRFSHTIMAINDKLSPPCPSWEGKYDHSLTGYCYGPIDKKLDSSLMDFINDGIPPVYIGFGSVSVPNPEEFTQMVLQAAEQTGTRIVLGQGWTGLGQADIPGYCYQVGDSSHGTLFPLMAGTIHHGGCGTTHTSARAGVPQCIMPQLADQFYWGERVHRLGLGPQPIAPKKVTTEKLVHILNNLQSPGYTLRAAEFSEILKDEDGVKGTANVVEELLGIEQPSGQRSHQKNTKG